MTYVTYFVIGLMPDIKSLVQSILMVYFVKNCMRHSVLHPIASIIMSSLSILINTSNRMELASKFYFRGNAGTLHNPLSLTAAKQ